MGNQRVQNKCECGWIGDDHELNHETIHDVFATGDYWNTEVAISCPKCGSDYIEEVVMCRSCLEAEAEEGGDDCMKCHKEAVEEEVVKFVQDNAVFMEELNGYAVRWNGELVTGCSPRDLVEQIVEGE